MSFLETFMTVSVTSDTKKAVGIHEIIKKKPYGQCKNKAAPILQFFFIFLWRCFWFVFFFIK